MSTQKSCLSSAWRLTGGQKTRSGITAAVTYTSTRKSNPLKTAAAGRVVIHVPRIPATVFHRHSRFTAPRPTAAENSGVPARASGTRPFPKKVRTRFLAANIETKLPTNVDRVRPCQVASGQPARTFRTQTYGAYFDPRITSGHGLSGRTPPFIA